MRGVFIHLYSDITLVVCMVFIKNVPYMKMSHIECGAI